MIDALIHTFPSLVIVLLFIRMGVCKGTCDSIQHHKAYDYKTDWRWHWDSFRQPKNIFGFVPDIWHLRDIERNLWPAAILIICWLCPVDFYWVAPASPLALFCGFTLSHKK